MAVTPLRPAGTFVWLALLSPQASTVPLDEREAERAAASDRGRRGQAAGTFVCPEELSPHATTVPLLHKARLWLKPALTDRSTLNQAGT